MKSLNPFLGLKYSPRPIQYTSEFAKIGMGRPDFHWAAKVLYGLAQHSVLYQGFVWMLVLRRRNCMDVGIEVKELHWVGIPNLSGNGNGVQCQCCCLDVYVIGS